jgi:hypothetical protein
MVGQPLQPSCQTDDEHVLILRSLFHFPQILSAVLGEAFEGNGYHSNHFFENQVSQGLKRIVCVRKRLLLSFTTKFRSFQALEPAAILFLMLLQAVLCWA